MCAKNADSAVPAFSYAEILLASLHATAEVLQAKSPSTDTTVHELRRSLKRLRAILDLPIKPRPNWVLLMQEEARSIHRSLAAMRDRRVVEDKILALRTKYPHRWPANLPPPPEASPETVPPIQSLRRQIEGMITRASARSCKADFDIFEALRRSYRSARRARAVAIDDDSADSVHTWRKKTTRLVAQLEVAMPWIHTDSIPDLELLRETIKLLGRSGDMAMVADNIGRRRFSATAAQEERDELIAWLERRRHKRFRRALEASEDFFTPRPRHFAEALMGSPADSRLRFHAPKPASSGKKSGRKRKST
jgi:CHAD domain-containing protein